jgi:hypothetical protein
MNSRVVVLNSRVVVLNFRVVVLKRIAPTQVLLTDVTPLKSIADH